jgi:hypothetical protein
VEEWSDDEIHQNLEDLQDFEFLNSVHRLRIDKWEHSRLNWDDHVRQLVHEDSFENEYGMPLSCYNGLVHILRPKLQKKDYNCRGELITTEHVVANGLRILGGGRPKDQRHIVGMSRDASYKSFCSFLDAVNSAPELDIKMPSTPDEWDEIYQEYRSKSTHEIMAGCVGCLDGFFQRTNKPTKLEVANVISYYSGHYESYGINCQACVRANLQFMYFGVVSPGSTNDNISFPLAPGLKEIFDSLPPGLFGLADAAYTLSEKLLIPFVGTDRCDPSQDAFNYYLSQLRIRVEMAFGRLVNKFRILSGKVGGSMDRVSAILMACARLHNFIIKWKGQDAIAAEYASVDDEMEALHITPNSDAPLGMSYLPVIPDEEFEAFPGISRTREAIVEHIREHDIRRPLHNIVRQRREQLELVVVSPNGSEIDREFISPV